TNSYFAEDLAELRAAGYLAAAVPTELGGWGLDLAQLAASQRRLARFAPATALAMTMHSYWVGIAVELERFGDSSLRWILDAAVAGGIGARGHAAPGNPTPALTPPGRAGGGGGGPRRPGRKRFAPTGPAGPGRGPPASEAAAPGGRQIAPAFGGRTTPGVTGG